MPEIDIGGQRIAYRELGEGRPPLLLVHGAGGSSRHFAGLLGPLGRVRHVVAIDLPGHGRSAPFGTAVPASELLVRYRDLCAELAERLGLGRFVLVGHSMGGAIGLLLAAAHPDRLARLVVVASAGRLRVADELLATIRDRFHELPALLAGLGYSPATDPGQACSWAATQLQAPPAVVLADFLACACFDLRAELPALRVPCSVIAAEDDRLTPKVLQERLCEAIPGAELHRVTRAGHFLLQERPDALAELLLQRVLPSRSVV
jgi:pimeloyl-ACP methyl ester carboxylesterase